ncbi:MAG TPA: hypothetical protein VNQ73_22360 [Ilumatobacter sp.]|nr:hypothetical protein [Ilumatobacter sp.]
MATSSSSTKKAAKLAKSGGSRAIRFQGGTVFPLAVAITLIVGLGLIVYARQSRPAADTTPPMVNDHWHMAYGFYLCDQWYALRGALEERDSQGNLANRKYLRTTIHSHDDGVIHWHPYTTVAVGKRAKLGIFLDNYNVELSDTALRFPENFVMYDPNDPAKVPVSVASEWVEGQTECNGEPAELSVAKWNLWSDTKPERYIANMTNIPMTNDGMAFTIIFAPRDTSADGLRPPTYEFLTELGAIDMGINAPDPNDFLGEDGSVVTLAEGTLPAGDTDSEGTEPEGTEPEGTTVPADSATATTGG